MTTPAARDSEFTPEDLRNLWRILSPDERLEGFRLLPHDDAEEFFLGLGSADLASLLLELPRNERRAWMRLLPPDDSADLIQQVPDAEREGLLALLDDATRHEVTALLAYAQDAAGGLMNPRYARLRPEMTVDEAIGYLRRQARTNLELLSYLYAIDADQRLLGVVSFRELFAARPERTVREVMRRDLVTVRDDQDQEEVSQILAQHDLIALPVVDRDGRMKGIVTVDDIVDVVQAEATEDIQKLGGMEAMEEPYLEIAFGRMLRRRGGWLSVLFVGELLTASAMAYFEDELMRAIVLSLFVPLIISSGGNSGSQASTLVVRAMSLDEVRLRDWWRVVQREIGAGLALGALLGALGFIRVVLWQAIWPDYGEHALLLGATVGVSLLGVVMFGTITGSLLPFLFRRLGFDPASASAPFVATLVDVSGLLIYFGTASLTLGGTLL
ncbi:MAG: magnesium transporter [Deltaproteobacteria bacterium]|nr:magnesium transporter [Deltaproteobacteria bacterium]